MKRIHTKPGLVDVISTTITEWFDSGSVTAENYHEKYFLAINSQSEIGWKHFFKGKMSEEWQRLQGRIQMQNLQYQEPEVWAAAIVETTLRSYIEVWKDRCSDVHDDSNLQEKQFAMHKLKDKAQTLFDLELECRPSDRFLFPSNTVEFLATSQAKSITRWIITSKRAIQNSITQAAKGASSRTRSIRTWFKPLISLGDNRNQRQQDRLIHDAYSKKKRHKMNRTIQSNKIDKYYRRKP